MGLGHECRVCGAAYRRLLVGILTKTPESSLLTWSCALIFWPRILLFAIGQSQQSLTPLESFLALHFGLLLVFSAVGLVINVRRVHSGSSFSLFQI